MPVVRTDDEARNLPWIFLGPGTWTWFPAPIQAYLVGIPLALTGSIVAAFAVPTPWLKLLLVAGWPVLVAFAVWSFFTTTSANRTITHHMTVLEAEVTGNRPEPDEGDVRITALPRDLLPKHMED